MDYLVRNLVVVPVVRSIKVIAGQFGHKAIQPKKKQIFLVFGHIIGVKVPNILDLLDGREAFPVLDPPSCTGQRAKVKT